MSPGSNLDESARGRQHVLARLSHLTRPAAQLNVPGGWWRLGYTTRFWVLLASASLLAGLAGAGLRLLLWLVQHLAWGYHAGEFVNAVGATSSLHWIVNLAIAGVLAGGVWWTMRRTLGSTGGELNDTLWSGEGRHAAVATLLSAVLSTTIIALSVSLGREQQPKDAAGVGRRARRRFARGS